MAEPRRVLEALLRGARKRMGRADLVIDGVADRGDEADVAVGAELRVLTGATRARAVEQGRLAAAALARMDAGTWGKCLACGEPIAPKRLAFAPEAEHCLACAEALELLAKRDVAAATAWEHDEDEVG